MKPTDSDERFEFVVDMIRKYWHTNAEDDGPIPFLCDALRILNLGGYSIEDTLEFIKALGVK